MDDIDAWIDDGELPTGTVDVCLQGDLASQVQQLDADLREMRAGKTDTLAAAGDQRKLAERIEALRGQMRTATREFHLRGLTWTGLQTLISKHRPRKDNDVDKALGFNRDSFFPAIILACLVDPDLTSAQWDKLEPRLSAGQFEELANKAWDLSKRKVDTPFSYAASATLQTSGETSSPQSD